MGYGDKLMALGDAWVLHQQDPKRRRVAVGNGTRLCKEHHELAHGMDHFLLDSLETGEDFEWQINFRSMRPYIDYQAMWKQCRELNRVPVDQSGLVGRLNRYAWKMDYRPHPAPVVLRPDERERAMRSLPRAPFVIVEPHIKHKAPPSKQWPISRFVDVAQRLSKQVQVFQISPPFHEPLPGIPMVVTDSFRDAMAVLQKATVYIGPEGGLHHAAAAVNTRAVVVYGGYVPPEITGYPQLHTNLTGDNDGYACGTKRGMCPHCARALDSITVEHVVNSAIKQLEKARAA